MLILLLLWRKWWNNRWLTAGTLAGLILVVAFTTSIPMYADGSLKRVISKTLLANVQGMPPGAVLVRFQGVGGTAVEADKWTEINRFIKEDLPEQVGMPRMTEARTLALRSAVLQVVDREKTDPSKRRQMALMAFSGLENQVKIVQGELPAPKKKGVNAVIPVIVSEDAIDRYNLRIGDQFDYRVIGKKKLRVAISGVYVPKDEASDYWFQGLEAVQNALIVNEEWFEQSLLLEQQYPLSLAYWYHAYDLRNIQSSQINGLSSVLQKLDRNVYERLTDTHVDISFLPLLETFRERSQSLQTLLLALALPMIALILVFLVIAANQSAERQRTEFAVLESRGASFRQLVMLVLLDAGLLGLMALIAGLPLGWVMAKSIGASNGFLQFVQRQAIPVGMGTDTLRYGILAVMLAVITYVMPVIAQAKTSIVQLKQKTARESEKPFWHRYGIDLILLGISGYGYYALGNQQWLIARTGLSGSELQLQPVLFIVPALALAGLGLGTLRILPWIMRLLNRTTRRWMPVPLYLTSTQLARQTSIYYPIMLLLMLTIGLGIYNAAAARTMDTNSEDRVRYQMGTDVRMTAVWESVAADAIPDPSDTKPSGATPAPSGKPGTGNGGGASRPDQPFTEPKLVYNEPPFEPFRLLPGVEAASRVLTHKTTAVIAGRSAGQGVLMGIDNVSFADVAWFRRDLYGFHPHHYLRVMGELEQAIVVSAKWAEQEQIAAGDVISLMVDDQPIEFVVAATAEYWPSLDPRTQPFFVANLDYIYDQSSTIPYTVWLKMKDGALVRPAVEALQQQNIQLAEIKDVRNALIVQQKLPSRGGVFGILSMGFLLTVIVSFMGYVMFWLHTLARRVVQLGIMRATGLSRLQLTGMLLLEQTLTSGTAIVLGLLYGQWVSQWFLPFLQTTESADAQLPPFRIVFEAQDTIQLLFVVFIMMTAGLILLGWFVRRLRVHQAIKLGEER